MLLFGLCLNIEKDFDTGEGQESTLGMESNTDSQGFGMRLDMLA
jgi:hypothetical protein